MSAAEAWRRVVGPEPGNVWIVGGLLQSHDYEFRLQAVKGTAVAEDLFSNPTAVMRSPPRIAAVRVKSGRRSLRLRWWTTWPVAQDVTFRVRWCRKGHPRKATSRRTHDSTLRIRGLRTGVHYRIVVRAWKAGVPGPRKRTLGIPLAQR